MEPFVIGNIYGIPTTFLGYSVGSVKIIKWLMGLMLPIGGKKSKEVYCMFHDAAWMFYEAALSLAWWTLSLVLTPVRLVLRLCHKL